VNAPLALSRILVIEDDDHLRPALVRALSGAYEVLAVGSAEEAMALVRSDPPFDAVLSDVNLCGMDGIELLRRIREVDLDLPFLLMTGEPTLDTAIRAVEHGAARYFRKPLDMVQLRKAMGSAVSLHKLAKARRQSQEEVGHPTHGAADRMGLQTVVDAAIGSLKLAWQPVVSWPRRRVVGYEGLMRSTLLPPDALLDAAERSGRVHELSRAVRRLAAHSAAVAPATDLFINLGPHELTDETLYDPQDSLSKLASRVVLEVTERASLEAIPDLRPRLARLRQLGYRIALDDLGSGYAGLASFAILEPEIVKIDMSLVRDVHRSATRRCLIASILAACRELRCTAIAEGVELPAERDALGELGCELLQGFLFARPGLAFPEPQW
jgi:EAL domain-containing protein (putative c-di-GMP-specific phosphodiesterase class I)